MKYGKVFMVRNEATLRRADIEPGASPAAKRIGFVMGDDKSVWYEEAGCRDAIRFSLDEEPEVCPGSPPWQRLTFEDRKGRQKYARISPVLAQAPYYRLADCIWLCSQSWSRLPLEQRDHQVAVVPLGANGESKVTIFKTRLPGDNQVIAMIDTLEHYEAWCEQNQEKGEPRIAEMPLKYLHEGFHRFSLEYQDRAERRKQKKQERQNRKGR